MAHSSAFLQVPHRPLREAASPYSHLGCLVRCLHLRTSRDPASVRLVSFVCTLSFVHQMQDDTTRVVQVAIASALPSLVQLLYALRGPLRRLLPWTKQDEAVTVRSRQRWFQFYLWLVCFFVEISVAAAFLAKAGNHPSAPVLFEVWRGVSLLAAETSVVIQHPHRPGISH